MESSWVSGKAPSAMRVVATGSRRSSASLRISGAALAADHPAAQVQHRPLGLVDDLGGRADLLDVPGHRGLVARQVDGGGLVVHGLRERHVHGDVDDHGAGAAGGGDVEGLVHDARQVGGVLDQVGVLDDRQGHAGDVGLLEGVGADEVAAHLPGDGDERRRVQIGGGDAGHQVGRAGTAGGGAHADLAGGAGVAVGRVRGALLVAHQHVPQVGVVQGVVERDGDAARDTRTGRRSPRVRALRRGLGSPSSSCLRSLQDCSLLRTGDEFDVAGEVARLRLRAA